MLLAEFESPEDLVRAVKQLRLLGHEDVETYTPHAVEELEALLPRPRLPWIAGIVGFLAAGGAYLLQWYLACVDYPLDVGGRPAHSPLAFVPIAFELGLLAASLTAVVGLFVGCGLPRLWRPIFEADGFERAAVDGFFIALPETAARDEARRALWATGARRVVAFGLLAVLLTGCDFQRMTDQRRPEPQVPPRGSVARGTVRSESSPPVTRALLARGRDRYTIFCAPCHGVLGDANTAIADRMTLRRPRSLQDEGTRAKAPEELYQVVKGGFGLMSSYEAQLPIEDRWAVAHYVKALQLSQSAPRAEVPGADVPGAEEKRP